MEESFFPHRGFSIFHTFGPVQDMILFILFILTSKKISNFHNSKSLDFVIIA